MKIQNDNLTFGSMIKPTSALKTAFSDVTTGEFSAGNSRALTRCLDSLLKDGKNDTIEISDRIAYGGRSFIETFVNGKSVVREEYDPMVYPSKGRMVLLNLKKLVAQRNPKFDCDTLGGYEIKAAKEGFNDPALKNDKNKISQKIYRANSERLENIRTEIFGA